MTLENPEILRKEPVALKAAALVPLARGWVTMVRTDKSLLQTQVFSDPNGKINHSPPGYSESDPSH